MIFNQRLFVIVEWRQVLAKQIKPLNLFKYTKKVKPILTATLSQEKINNFYVLLIIMSGLHYNGVCNVGWAQSCEIFMWNIRKLVMFTLLILNYLNLTRELVCLIEWLIFAWKLLWMNWLLTLKFFHPKYLWLMLKNKVKK